MGAKRFVARLAGALAGALDGGRSAGLVATSSDTSQLKRVEGELVD